MKEYVCIKGMLIEKCDDDGFAIENDYFDLEVGTVWHTPEDEEYRFIGGEIRLESDSLGWIEISKEDFEKHFELI